jgi:phage gp46-like protein
MSIHMTDRDYLSDGLGSVASVSGGSALLEDILFRLTARRGGFALLPEFGSRMYLLSREKPSARNAVARQYAAEALADLGDVEVTGAWVKQLEGRLQVQVELNRQGETLAAELEVSA